MMSMGICMCIGQLLVQLLKIVEKGSCDVDVDVNVKPLPTFVVLCCASEFIFFLLVL